MKILSAEQIIRMHSRLIDETGGTDGLRDKALLESALQTPFQSFGGIPMYPTLVQKAARLCCGLVQNHAFVDGNKRIGAHAMLVFLMLNGVMVDHTQRELSDIILGIASGSANSNDLEEWLDEHVKHS